MTNKILLLGALMGVFLLPAFGQGMRYDNRALTVAGNMPPFANAPVLAIPKAKVTICTDGNCLNAPATIYSNQALTVQTSNPITTDGQGRFGFWAAGGTYFYKVVLPSGTLQGIYPFTLGGSGGASGFPITLGSTSIAQSSTTTAVNGLSVNGVNLNAVGSTSLFLNQAGGYTSPAGGGGGNVSTSGTTTSGSYPLFNGTTTITNGHLTDNGSKVLSSLPVQTFSGSNFANINATATNSEVNLSTSSSSSVDVLSYANASLTTFGFDYFGTGNGSGLAGALGLFDTALNVFVWNTNQTDDLFFGTPLSGGNVVAGTGAVAKLDHLGNLTVNSCTGCGGAGSGFPITIGSTSITSSSTTTSVAGLTVNGVALNAAGSSGLFLNQAGGYTAPSASLADCTDTSTVSFICTVPISAPSFSATGTTPGAFKLTAGTGSIPALAANSGGFAAPVTGGTSYLFKLPATITAGILHAATPGTVDGVNESALTSSAVSLSADVTGQLPIGNVGSAGLSGTSPLTVASTGVIACATCAITSNPLSQFAATTSAQLLGVISDETGTGALVFGTAPTITLANGTGLPISTGVSGLGTSVATFLATPSSANLRAALTDESGTGAALFAGGNIGAATGTSLLVTGNVDGTAPVTITTGTTATLGGTFKSGYTLNQEATAATAVAYTLPTAAAGLQYCIGNSWNGSAATTGVLTLNTSASGQFIIFTDGTLSATGGNITSGGAAADAACVVGVDATHWQLFVQRGTWTKH